MFTLGFESASLRKKRRPQRRRSALRLLVIIAVARAPRSSRLVAGSTAGRGTNRRREPRDFGGAKTPPFRLLPKVSKRVGKSRVTPFLFNDITALCSHLLCFLIHSRFTPSFQQSSFVFNNIPASFRQKKEFFLRGSRLPVQSKKRTLLLLSYLPE